MLKAADVARAATGLDVPIERAAVADAPYFYEDRIRPAPLRLKKLRVMVPERHDLALMKVVRGDRHDVDVIAEIHTKHPLKLATLVKRFEEEMGHVIKDEKRALADRRSHRRRVVLSRRAWPSSQAGISCA